MNKLEKLFVPYDLALKLKDLGFKEDCIRYYDFNENLVNYFNLSTIVAPLWQQAFLFMREKIPSNYSFELIGTRHDNEVLYSLSKYDKASQKVIWLEVTTTQPKLLEKLIEIYNSVN